MREDRQKTFGTAPRRAVVMGALLGLVAAAGPLVYLRGFTVDDALIIARYAANVASGHGHRFHPSDAPSDGVTPLGFAYLLAPFAAGGVLSAFFALRTLGAIAWLVAASALGIAVARASSHPLRFGSLLLVATSAPLGAWAMAGLETGMATMLATLAVVLPKGPRTSLFGAFFAGLFAWLRPEALPFALVIGAGRGYELASRHDSRPRASAHAKALFLSALPFLLVVAVRLWAWQRPIPLSAIAKPADLVLGFRKLDAFSRFVLVAGFVHFGAVALAGGDWMPLSRLVVPVLPAFVYVTAHLLSTPKPIIPLARLGLALVGTIFVFVRVGPVAKGVLEDRLALVESAREALEGAERVAAVDIGWLGAATPARIVDLAGVTDLEVAALPGGHTSKTISLTMLTRREVDALVLLDPPRTVEARLLRDPALEERFEPVWRSPPELPVRYVIWRRKIGTAKFDTGVAGQTLRR